MDTNTKEIKERNEEEMKEKILRVEQGLIDTIIRMYQQYVSIETISDFTNLSIEQLQQIVDDNKEVIRKMDEEKKQKELRENKEIRRKAYIAGRKKGLDDGIDSAIDVLTKKDMVTKMYKDNLSIETISLYTDLTTEEIKKIIKEIKEK